MAIWQSLLQQLRRLRPVTVPGLVRHGITGWLWAVLLEYLQLPKALKRLEDLQAFSAMSMGRVLGLTLLFAVMLFLAARLWNTEKAERWLPLVAFSILAVAVLQNSFTWMLLMVCIGVAAILGIYGWKGWAEESPVTQPQPAASWHLGVTVAASVLFFLLVSAWTVGRVYSFSAPTYDFGIFVQMFHNMKETGLPMTTVERDGLLSHFAVHVSPIYYLMLPFYCLVPRPETLQVLQAAVITSAVIPLWLIGRHHGLTGGQRATACLILMMLPAFSGGVGYDIHENCFLTPLILWLLYGIDRKNWILAALAGILTLMVKEDAAVYVAVIALWLIVRTLLKLRKENLGDLLVGMGLLAVSLVWFFQVTEYLANSGDGVMTYRYENFMYDDSGSLMTVIKAVIQHPMKAVYECVDPEKLKYIGLTLLPLGLLPLITRHYERYLLLIPYILVNLMSDYQYQHHILFQYNFGSTACLIYLTVVNLADLEIQPYRFRALLAVALISLGCFRANIIPTATDYPKLASNYYGYYQNIRNTLDKIPEDASVAATTFYAPALAQREVLYDIRYAAREHVLECEYVVLNLRSDDDYSRYRYGAGKTGLEHLTDTLERKGYRIYAQIDGVLAIYYKPAASEQVK